MIAGIAAFATWGLVPIYWKLLKAVPAEEILAHRFVWTWLFMVALLSWQRRWPEVVGNMRSPRTFWFCVASGMSIAVNWLVFIWAVNADLVIETSLGYFMTPLVNMLFGAIFFRERLTRAQLASVGIATGAVIYLTIDLGAVPWVALALCISFGTYGLFRKVSGAAPTPGLFVETTALAPLALVFLLYIAWRGVPYFQVAKPGLSLLLISTGIVTGIPLLWFAHAARHLRLTTIGFLQYLAPMGTFCLGLFLYHEPFRRAQLVTFVLIWIALVIYTTDAVWRWRAGKAIVPVPPLEM
ncbi:MAG: EamA family transporter RarD [Chthoniobacterales bacterium]